MLAHIYAYIAYNGKNEKKDRGDEDDRKKRPKKKHDKITEDEKKGKKSDKKKNKKSNREKDKKSDKKTDSPNYTYVWIEIESRKSEVGLNTNIYLDVFDYVLKLRPPTAIAV